MAASTASSSTRSFISSPECPWILRNLTGLAGSSASREQRFPQVLVGHRRALTVAPLSALPSGPPSLLEAIDDVRRVAHDEHRTIEGAKRLQDGRHLHALVGGRGGRATGVGAAWHCPSPTAGPGIPQARPICVHGGLGLHTYSMP